MQGKHGWGLSHALIQEALLLEILGWRPEPPGAGEGRDSGDSDMSELERDPTAQQPARPPPPAAAVAAPVDGLDGLPSAPEAGVDADTDADVEEVGYAGGALDRCLTTS